jgi:hypothetical protein
MASAMKHLFQMTHHRHQRQSGFDQHPLVPGAAWTQLEMGWNAVAVVEPGIGQHDAFVFQRCSGGSSVLTIESCAEQSAPQRSLLLIRWFAGSGCYRHVVKLCSYSTEEPIGQHRLLNDSHTSLFFAPQCDIIDHQTNADADQVSRVRTPFQTVYASR